VPTECGFTNLPYFYRQYVAYFGSTPAARRKLLGNRQPSQP
jgi:AraC-like DNA-binding protein